jgi:hypothetical protein
MSIPRSIIRLNGKPSSHLALATDDDEAVGGRGGCSPAPQESTKGKFRWKIEKGARRNYRLFGERLAQSVDLFRNGSEGLGLILVLPSGNTKMISKASELAPVIADRVSMLVTKDGKVVSELPKAEHLNAMLRSEVFLTNFPPVDQVVRNPFYADDFSICHSGYNDGGPGKRVLFIGKKPEIADSIDTITRFLDVMDFATAADRTNTVGAALTVRLRNLWLGQKPLVLVTATKSHAGKGTITDFVRGLIPKADILYEPIDWPMQAQFQRQIKATPEIGLVLFDNVRLDSAGKGKLIRSAFLESFVTSPEVTLASPSAGELVALENRFVALLNTNDGALSTDLLNRALTICLSPRGNIQDRVSPIGNPKLEFLPLNGERIEAELRGMIKRWKQAGQPLDETVRHPMTPWARTIGGILQVNGFSDFLANFGNRKTADDPIREALSIIGAAKPEKELRPADWAKIAVEQGFAKILFSPVERDTEKGRQRGIGVVLKRHINETFEVKTETTLMRLRLIGGNRRWTAGKNAHVRYKFEKLHEERLPEDSVG